MCCVSFFCLDIVCVVVQVLCGSLCRCYASFRTLAAFWLVTQPVMRFFAALAALSLHVDFTATLTGDQTGSNVSHPVTYSSIQRAQRVTVTGYRNTYRTKFIVMIKTLLQRFIKDGFIHLDLQTENVFKLRLQVK